MGDYKMPNLNITNLQNQLNTPDTDSIMQDSNLRKAYQDYLTNKSDTSSLPTPENIIPQTIQGIKNSSGIIPKIVTGLGGIINLANTSAGHRLVSQAMGGDVEHKTAMENVATQKKNQELGLAGMLAQQEEERKKALASYGNEQMKAHTEAERENAQEQFQAEEQAKAFGQQSTMQKGTQAHEEKTQAKAQLSAQQEQTIKDNGLTGNDAQNVRQTQSLDDLHNMTINRAFKVPFLGSFGGSAIPKASSNEIQRLDKTTGKIAIYDSNKNFLRWK